jgi:hypothetical protein
MASGSGWKGGSNRRRGSKRWNSAKNRRRVYVAPEDQLPL